MKVLIKLLEMFCFLLIALLVIILCVSVISRYILHNPAQWIEEAGSLALVWLTFFGAVITAHKNSHMGMDLLFHKINKATKGIYSVVINLVIIASIIIVIYFGIKLTIHNIHFKSEVLRISYAYFYLAVPVSFILFVIVELDQIINQFKKFFKSVDPGSN